MNKLTSLVVICLLLAISTASQTPKQHFNLGMTIDEFTSKSDGTGTNTPEALYFNAAVRAATKGKRVLIQINADGTRMALLFNKHTLREIEVTAGNTFDRELQVLTEELGDPNVSKINSAMWDRRDGTRFSLTSRQGIGVLLVAPTPEQNK
jgi:hypothetical protein